MDLKNFFNPQSIAIVGASAEEGKVGNAITKNILNLGYKGKVFLVNPKHQELFNKKCYSSLSAIKEKVELAIIVIPAKFVLNEIENNAEKIKNFVIISAGFSEIGIKGKEEEKKILALAEKNKLNILGPNCLGFIVPSLKLNASFAGGMPQSGGISFISQSGALAVALLDRAKKENIKFSNIISIGNKMQINEANLLEFMAEDKNTQVIGMYLEGIKEGKEFMAVAQKVSKAKPVIILKVGKSDKTQKAISSHTGALAGDDEVISAVFKKTGILRAHNLEEFFDLFNLINENKKSPNKEVVVITNAGGVGVLTADAFQGKGIQLADLDEKIKEELREFLPLASSVENPIDILGDASQERYQKALAVIDKISSVGSIICILTPQEQTPTEKIADEIIKFKQKTNKVIVTIFLGGDKVEKSILKLKKNGICNFSFPDQAVKAMDGYYRWNEFKKLKIKNSQQIINQKRRAKVMQIIQEAQAENRKALYFSEAQEIMDMYGINSISYLNILPKDNEVDFSDKQSVFENKINFPVVLKVDSDKVLHKTDKGGLRLNIENQEQLAQALQEMKNKFSGERLIVQPMTNQGAEIIVGIKQDANFGAVIVYGLGGIYTELLHQVDYLVPPLSLSQIEDSLQKGKLSFLFQKTRGQEKYDLEEMAQLLYGISFLALEMPEIKEFDINPLIIYNNKQKAVAVDIKIIIR
jgi:acetyltransferase